MRRALFLAPILAAALAAPAHASTIPDAGLRRGQVAVALGLVDTSVDWSPIDRLQVGAGGYFTLFGTGGYGRLTYRLLADSPIGDVAFHVAGGKYNAVLAKTDAHEGHFAFAGPVVAKSF